MYIKQLYTNCLAHAAYYIESGKEVAIIDPLRNPEPYMALAHERGATIKYVMETHFHADFVSGHIDLSNKTGATIVFGPDAAPGYKAYIATDGEQLPLGNAHIKVIHTPGHTIESACYLLLDEAGKPNSVFTGDTLFIGDVGRPDLLSGNLKKEELAAIMFESLKKIKMLPDEITVYPGHGAGSACGKNIGPESQSTIGHEKQFNYALKLNDKDSFITAITTGQPIIPGYFFSDAAMNKSGYTGYDEVLQKSMQGLSIDQFKDMQANGATVLDTRDAQSFAAAFVPGAINVGLSGDFATWVGIFIAPDAQILLVTEPGKEEEAIERLARIGYDHVSGYLQGGMHSWFTNNQGYENIPTFESHTIQDVIEEGSYNLLDVRNRKEVAKDRITGSFHIPLNELITKYTNIEKNSRLLIYCAGGYRSMIAASFLRSKGFHFVASVEGGINKVRNKRPEMIEAGMETE
ncbi:MAG: fold metallo-hydrolase [Flavipsychrobacter sp.]|nr:fold metallo-hydrolase [Flavipsychrobacter sp.]